MSEFLPSFNLIASVVMDVLAATIVWLTVGGRSSTENTCSYLGSG
jgi:hypothetical protein